MTAPPAGVGGPLARLSAAELRNLGEVVAPHTGFRHSRRRRCPMIAVWHLVADAFRELSCV
jgi:hypothetical protein